ncbi:MAG: tetratricopeptide repeat protein [Nitrospinae bacterium]|nr:tetratricopeptide repeat protein [Nitrospinota bacterium]
MNSYCGDGVRMEGLLKFRGALRFEGNFKGEINTPDTLIIGETGKLEAKIEAGSFFNMGEVNGDVRASKKISILTGSRLKGNIDTPALVSEEGALFMGKCVMPAQAPAALLEEKESNLKRAINKTFQNLFTATGEKEEPQTTGLLSKIPPEKRKMALGGSVAAAIMILLYGMYFYSSSKTSMGSTLLSRYIYERAAQDNPAKLLLLADVYFNEEHYSRAATTYARLREISPPDPAVTKRLAISLEKSGNMEEAASYYEETLKNEPQDNEIITKLADYYQSSGNTAKLIGVREFIASSRPADVDAAKALYALYLENKDTAKALELYKARIAASPKTVDDLLTMGKLQKQAGLLPEAIKTLTEAVVKNFSNKEAILELGYAYHKAGQEEKSLDIFLHISRLDPQHPEAVVNAGFSDLAMGKTDKAVEEFNRTLSANPGNMRALLGLAIASSRLGDGGKAEQYCKKMLEADPDYSPALNRLAWLYAQQKRNLDEAEKYSLASMKYNENLPDYMDTLSEIYYQKRNYDKAIEIITRAIELRPTNPYFLTQLEKFSAAKRRLAPQPPNTP